MFFQGRALWHCSVALQGRTMPLPLATWQARHWEGAAALHAQHLLGVGDQAEEVRHESGIAWHLRRVCTPDELAQLTRRGALKNGEWRMENGE